MADEQKLPGLEWHERMSVLIRIIMNREIVGGCWIWKGLTDKRGYGRIGIRRKHQFVHNIAYRLWKGPISEGMEPDHLCQINSCFNPEHLEAVDHPENTRRGKMAKLTHTDVIIIRALDEPHTETARFFGVHPSTICDIRNYRRWNYAGRSS